MGRWKGISGMSKKEPKYITATIEEVWDWLADGVYTVHDGGKVYKGTKLLAQRTNCRQRMDDGDPRVDLWHLGKRRSCHVSQLVWMVNAGCPIPEGFEMHHRDENPHNNVFNNLLCIHKTDHPKLHEPEATGVENDEIPF